MKIQTQILQFQVKTILELNDRALSNIHGGSGLGELMQALSIGTVSLM